MEQTGQEDRRQGLGGLTQVLLVTLDRLLDAQQHGGEPLVQPGDGVVILHLRHKAEVTEGAGPTPTRTPSSGLVPEPLVLKFSRCVPASLAEEERGEGLPLRLPRGKKRLRSTKWLSVLIFWTGNRPGCVKAARSQCHGDGGLWPWVASLLLSPWQGLPVSRLPSGAGWTAGTLVPVIVGGVGFLRGPQEMCWTDTV